MVRHSLCCRWMWEEVFSANFSFLWYDTAAAEKNLSSRILRLKRADRSRTIRHVKFILRSDFSSCIFFALNYIWTLKIIFRVLIWAKFLSQISHLRPPSLHKLGLSANQLMLSFSVFFSQFCMWCVFLQMSSASSATSSLATTRGKWVDGLTRVVGGRWDI